MSERRRRSAKRHQSYMEDRLYYENLIRELFLGMNGKVERRSPHYMVVEHSPWLSTWYGAMKLYQNTRKSINYMAVSVDIY